MPINTIDNFSVNVSKPIDTRMVVANSSDRNSITYKYDGMKVFQQDDRKTYVWNSGTSTWTVENELLLTDGYVPKFSTSGLTNSVIFSTASSVGINTSVPRSAFQVSDTGISQPINIGFLSTDAILSYNWYYNGSDQTFNASRGSSILQFGDSGLNLKIRNVGDSNSGFNTVMTLGKYTTHLYARDSFSLTGSTVSISGTNSIVLATDDGYIRFVNSPQITEFTADIPDTGFATFSMNTKSGYPSSILIESSSFFNRGGDINLVAGNGLVFKSGSARGGSINLIAGQGLNNGATGGSVSIIGGPGSGGARGGDVYIIPGSYGASYSNVHIGYNRLRVSENDVYAYVHNTGTSGLGNSGNTVDPYNYPTIASGQLGVTASSFINCSSVIPGAIAWLRVGNVVNVSGRVTFIVSTANAITEFKLRIPIKSIFGNDSGGGNGNNWQLNGVGKVKTHLTTGNGTGGDVASIQAYADSNPAEGYAHFMFRPSVSGSSYMTYTYQYVCGSYVNTAGGGGGGGGGPLG